MNRPIKFRAKGKSDGQWHYGSLIQIGDDYSIATNTATAFEMCVVAPETVGQFTGLYDKNGKEIYEGDILQSDKPNASLCVVFWSTEKTAFSYRFYWKRIDDAHEIGKKSRYAIGDWNMIEKGLAVIGNIYGNPELIEKIEQLNMSDWNMIEKNLAVIGNIQNDPHLIWAMDEVYNIGDDNTTIL